MSYTLLDTSKAHQRYEYTSRARQRAVDKAFAAAVLAIKDEIDGFEMPGDDRAEELVAAIYYFIERAEG